MVVIKHIAMKHNITIPIPIGKTIITIYFISSTKKLLLERSCFLHGGIKEKSGPFLLP
jgi:hypothetical protein